MKSRRIRFYINTRVLGVRVLFFQGAHAWELQLGSRVLQRFYEPFQGRRFHAWVDPVEAERS